MTTKQPSPLWEKLSAIRRDLGSFKKEGHNDFNNYNFVSYDQVMERLQPLLIDAGVFLVQSCREMNTQQVRDGRTTKATGMFGFYFVDIDTGEVLPNPSIAPEGLVFPGEGEDVGDKAINKAGTAAYKYFVLKFFGVVTDEPDPDAQSPAVTPPATTPAKKAEAPAKPADDFGFGTEEPLNEGDPCPTCAKMGVRGIKGGKPRVKFSQYDPLTLVCNGNFNGQWLNHKFPPS